jgi:hypothetical protein
MQPTNEGENTMNASNITPGHVRAFQAVGRAGSPARLVARQSSRFGRLVQKSRISHQFLIIEIAAESWCNNPVQNAPHYWCRQFTPRVAAC